MNEDGRALKDALVNLNQRGGGGEVSPRKLVIQAAYQYDVTSRVSDFQNGEQSVYRRPRVCTLAVVCATLSLYTVTKTKVRFFALKNLMSKRTCCGALSLEVHM